MFNTIITKAWRALVCGLLLGSLAWAQTPVPTDMVSKFVVGTSSRYEFEGLVHIATEHAAGVKINVPSDCSYSIKAVLKFDFSAKSAEGALSGQVSLQGVTANIPECASAKKARVTELVKDLESKGMGFEIAPAGDVRLTRPFRADEPELVVILRKAAWDLLQPDVSDKSMSRNSPWVSSRKFLFWPDTFVDGMEVAASSGHYAGDVQIGRVNCAALEYQQVFSPTDLPAYVDARSRATDFTGTTMVTGHGSVSLLWNRDEQRIVYLHRKRTVDNRMLLRYDPEDETKDVARYLMEEESTLRWLPEENSEAWLAELHRFESSASEVSAEAKAAGRKRQEIAEREISDITDRTPRGFERWRKTFCHQQFCFELSVAVPEGTEVADSSAMTALLIGKSGEKTVTIAVGPILDVQGAGLTEEELLRQQTGRMIQNDLWFARGTGEPLNFDSESLHDRPAGGSDFSAKSRGLTPMRGRLVMVIGPYGRLVPVACAHAESEGDLEAVCQAVTWSILIQ
jgi:hypothetical protein